LSRLTGSCNIILGIMDPVIAQSGANCDVDVRRHRGAGNGGIVTIEERVQELGLILPDAFRSPSSAVYPFSWVRVRGNRAYISGHLPLQADGTLAEPRGKVGDTVSIEQAAQAARLVGLAMLGSLKRELGDLERVAAWLHVLGMVNISPGTTQLPQVVNGFSNLIIDVYGRDRGAHARSAVGMAELPFGVPVEIEAEVEIVP
jgi:enamine deaminase RidA (YjgF/YER057c/UK114 family)